jgi:multidrug efflux pump subunit AcrB
MSSLFFRNPRLTALFIGLVIVAGGSSWYVMPRMEDPLLTERFALVNTLFPGADAERVEALVTEKLEDELREIEEIRKLRSVSRSGISMLTIELRDDVYADTADEVWSRIRDQLDDAAVEFPAEAAEPQFEKMDVKAYALIVGLAWVPPDSGEQYASPNYAILRRLAEQLEGRIRAVSGTELIDTFGDPDEQLLVALRQDEAAAIGLTVQDVARQLSDSDARLSAGQLRGGSDLLLEVSGELDSIARISRTPIQFGSDGRFVRLSDIATVQRGITEPPSSLAVVDGKPAVVLGVMVRSTERLDHWSARVSKVLDEFSDELPTGVVLDRVFEQSRYVDTRLSTLLGNLMLGGVAVLVVILVMMGWRNALVVGAALPLSAFIVLSGLRLLDIPIHQMSVTGLIVALGLLIDNAIVIVDEVTERLKNGIAPVDAVSRSVSHLAVPLLGSTLTTAFSFAPIALMPGPAGEFVGSIAVSVILAIFSSLLLALTVVPALGAWGRRAESFLEASRWWNDGVQSARLTRWYEGMLDGMFRRPLIGVVVGAVIPVLGFSQFGNLSEQFFPPADRDQFQIELELPASASLAETMRTTEKIREVLLEYEDVRHVGWFLGESAPMFYYNLVPRRRNTASYAQAFVQVDSADRSRELIHKLQRRLDHDFSSCRVLVRQLEQGPPFDAPVEVRVYGPDLDRLRDIGDELRLTLSETPHVIHSRTDLGDSSLKLALHVDEDQARLARLSNAAIAKQLNASLEGMTGGAVLEGTEELPVRVRVSNEVRSEMDAVVSLDLRPDSQGATATKTVPLTALSDVELLPEIATILHFDGRRMNEVQAYVTAGTLPAEVLADFQQRLADANFTLPPGYSMELGGEAAERNNAVGNLMANVGVLGVLMVATLVLSFNSFRMASIVGVVAFLAVGPGIGALSLSGYPFGFMAIVGSMGLIGVAINDAIVVLAAIREDVEARTGSPKAIRQVVVRSTRHVLATSLTTIAGFAPLILGGGGFWPPLAVCIAGGVGAATILALTLTPAMYVMLMCPKCPIRAAEASLATGSKPPIGADAAVV